MIKKLIPGTSLRHIVANLPDFKQEITLLQFRAKQLGVSIDCTPKFHPEIAGEGVEFCWGLSKIHIENAVLRRKEQSVSILIW